MSWLGVALVALAIGQTEPSEHTVIYYNARMALREGQPLEATRLWLLRNALESRTGRVSPHDADFGSVTWAALGAMGICQDGHPTDEDGAGLWPVALHNQVVRNRGRTAPAKPPAPFAAYQVGRQQRLVAIGDVLSAEELRTVSFFRGPCWRARLEMLYAGEAVNADLSDRQVAARLLRRLLERSRETLAADRIRGMSAVEARLFDLDLQLTALAAREARQAARERAGFARQLGVSRESVAAMRDEAPHTTLDPDSEAARILAACVHWPAAEWVALSPDRRLFLFDQARAHGGEPEALDRAALAIVDALIAAGEGAEVERWIARAPAEASWSGARGRQLLTLDVAQGFRERGVIALHRGVDALQRGELPESLRALAYALRHAPESSAADEVSALALRWLSFVGSQYTLDEELLATLQEIVPPREHAILLEDLLWSAAFRADRASFDRGVERAGRGALSRRLALLEPLAKGDVGAFSRGIRAGLAESPSETLRFLDQLVQRLELEDADVRSGQVPTLLQMRALLEPLADPAQAGGQQRRAAAWTDRSQAILDGIGASGAGPRVRARALAPAGEVYAGSVRLAPVDALPWPFRAADVPPPSVFEPLVLTPMEWRDASGAWVLGWSIGD